MTKTGRKQRSTALNRLINLLSFADQLRTGKAVFGAPTCFALEPPVSDWKMLMGLRDFCRCLKIAAFSMALTSSVKPLYAFQKQAPNVDDPSTVQDFEAGDKVRETQDPADIIDALHLSRGEWVADVGAGDGYYSMRLSKIVGPTGKVFDEDIWDMAIAWSTRRAAAFRLKNVVVVKGRNDNPELPEKAFAGVLVVDAYHHFTHYERMDEHILKALRPGGRLVIADYSLPSHRGEARSAQTKIHEISPDIVKSELRQAGFVVLTCKDPFVRRMPSVTNGDRRIVAADMWLLVAIRPTR